MVRNYRCAVEYLTRTQTSHGLVIQALVWLCSQFMAIRCGAVLFGASYVNLEDLICLCAKFKEKLHLAFE